jgi:hypothetical protein
MHWQVFPESRDGQECSPDAGLAGEWQQPQQRPLLPARTLPAPQLQHSGQLKIVAISKMGIDRLNIGNSDPEPISILRLALERGNLDFHTS